MPEILMGISLLMFLSWPAWASGWSRSSSPTLPFASALWPWSSSGVSRTLIFPSSKRPRTWARMVADDPPGPSSSPSSRSRRRGLDRLHSVDRRFRHHLFCHRTGIDDAPDPGLQHDQTRLAAPDQCSLHDSAGHHFYRRGVEPEVEPVKKQGARLMGKKQIEIGTSRTGGIPSVCGRDFAPGLLRPAKPVLNVYTWADYIKPDLLSRFEKENGCRVEIEPLNRTRRCMPSSKPGPRAMTS